MDTEINKCLCIQKFLENTVMYFKFSFQNTMNNFFQFEEKLIMNLVINMFIPYLVTAWESDKKVIEMTRLKNQLKAVAMETPVLRAQSG